MGIAHIIKKDTFDCGIRRHSLMGTSEINYVEIRCFSTLEVKLIQLRIGVIL